MFLLMDFVEVVGTALGGLFADESELIDFTFFLSWDGGCNLLFRFESDYGRILKLSEF